MKAAAVYSLDPAREERGEGRPDSSSRSPLLLGRGAAAHTRAHALHSSSCCFPLPQASAAPPVLVPHYLPVCLSVSSSACASVPSPCACLHVQPCLRVSRSPRACLAPRNGSGCPGLPAHLRPSVFFCSVTLVCLPLPASAFQRLPASLLAFVHLPPLALFILVNRTGTCIQAPCAQVGWNCAG